MSTVRFFRTFVAVARQGSFAAAAERVALTQAAVSLQMRALEDELKRPLFDRSGRTVVLNDEGKRLLPQAEALLALYENMRGAGPQAMSGGVGIGAVVSAMGPLARAVAGLKRSYPQLDVRVLAAKSGELATMVEQGDLDAAIVVESPTRLQAGMQFTPLYAEPVVLVAPRGVRGDDVRRIAAQSPFLRFDRTQRTGVLIERALRRARLEVNEFLELNAIEALVELVRQEVGITVVPSLQRGRWERDRALRVMPLPGAPMERRIGMLQRREHPRRHITAAVQEAFEGLMD
jgi:DNA-binding transcriptional LysR family regulator